MKNWEEFNKFNEVIDKYMPAQGEGETMATQTVAAVNKLIHKWYNDGDVFDNTHALDGWANDISSFANWLVRWVRCFANCLYGIRHIRKEGSYEDLLMKLAEQCLNEDALAALDKIPKHGSIYDCDGPFHFVEKVEDEESDEDDYEDEQDDEREDEDE